MNGHSKSWLIGSPGQGSGRELADLRDPVRAVHEIRRSVEELGFVAVRVVPWLWDLPPNDRRYYPIYVACVELGVPFCTQIGHTGPLCRSEPGRPIPYLDDVLLDFPELVVVGGHVGYPWIDEVISLDPCSWEATPGGCFAWSCDHLTPGERLDRRPMRHDRVSGAVRVVEHHQLPAGDHKPCEDICVIDDRPGEGVRFLAVIDGATDKSGITYAGKTSGLLAAEAVAAAVAGFERDVDAPTAAREMTAAVAAMRSRLEVPEETTMPPTAAVAVYSVARRELWRVGDVHLSVRGTGGDLLLDAPGEKMVDIATSYARSAHNAILIAKGADRQEIARTDPGRELIVGILAQQAALANHPQPMPFSYGVIDGTTVPDRFVEVHPVDEGDVEVVMATDGYLTPAATLAEAEAELAESLARDPLRIGQHPSTKGVRPGANSFDDRTYLRFELSP